MEPQLTIIATAYGEPEHNRVFVDSMLNQTYKDFRIVIIHNGENSTFREWCNGDAYQYGKIGSNKNFLYRESSLNTGNWGIENRIAALNGCDTEYILQTSIQDYYIPIFIEEVTKAMESKPDIITFPALNHIFGYATVPGILAHSRIDWGQFILRTEVAKQGTIMTGPIPCADWYYLEDIMKKGLLKNHIHIPKILTIHN